MNYHNVYNRVLHVLLARASGGSAAHYVDPLQGQLGTPQQSVGKLAGPAGDRVDGAMMIGVRMDVQQSHAIRPRAFA